MDGRKFEKPEVENSVADVTHKVVEDEETGKKYQYEFRENPECMMNKMGYTEEEVKAILK